MFQLALLTFSCGTRMLLLIQCHLFAFAAKDAATEAAIRAATESDKKES